jgi:hypothetical protein
MTTAAVPDVVAGYRVTRLLGSGDLGAVYLSHNPALPRQDALKVLTPQLSVNATFAAEFVRSVETSSNLSHSNIVPIYASGEFEQRYWVATQFVDGGDVDAALRHGDVKPGRAIHIVAEVAKALDYAHQQHITHSAVHPGNILLTTADSGTERVLLSDFGSAEALDAAGRPRSSRRAAPYSAPEVLDGAPYGLPADVYSLGCVLFRLWTGRVPDLSQPVEWTTGLPGSVAAVLARATARDPALRFGSAGEFAAAAAAASQAESARGQALLDAESERHRSRLRRWGAAAAAAVLAGAVVLAMTQVSGREVEGRATKSTALPTPVAVKDLPRLLLGADELDKVVGVSMAVAQDEAKLGLEPHDNAGCAGAFMPSEVREYTSTGYLGVQFQRWTEVVPPGGVGGVLPWISQAVVAFPNAAVAELFRTRETQRWGKCDNQQLDLGPVQIVFSDVHTTDNGVLTLKQTLEGGLGIGCNRALAVRNNVAVDVVTCYSDDDLGKALAIVEEISDRITE